MKLSPSTPDKKWDIQSLQSFPSAHKRVEDLLKLSSSLDIEPSVLEDVEKRLARVISSVQHCLKNPSQAIHIVEIINNLLKEIGGKKLINQIYNISPMLMKHFVTMSLELQFLYLFATDRGEVSTWAIWHHWTVFWFNFWQACKKETPYEKLPTRICQVVDSTGKIRFDYHTFCLLDLDKRYIMNADGKKWITIREARIFSEMNNQIYKTTRIQGVPTVEKVHTFRSAKNFAREIDSSLSGANIWEVFLRILWEKLQE